MKPIHFAVSLTATMLIALVSACSGSGNGEASQRQVAPLENALPVAAPIATGDLYQTAAQEARQVAVGIVERLAAHPSGTTPISKYGSRWGFASRSSAIANNGRAPTPAPGEFDAAVYHVGGDQVRFVLWEYTTDNVNEARTIESVLTYVTASLTPPSGLQELHQSLSIAEEEAYGFLLVECADYRSHTYKAVGNGGVNHRITNSEADNLELRDDQSFVAPTPDRSGEIIEEIRRCEEELLDRSD